ncbi:MAG: hypothetical protein JSW71_04150 [Gemmatimonadota bacterium]|nr:MAG: hypothetical protein JSW71_04150 [Gemmatimonadota bacterium]
MPAIEPLPFRLRVPGEDVIDFKGIQSVSYRVEGLLHLVDDTLEFEWSATEKTERVSFAKIGTEVDRSPIGRLEVPAGWLAEVRLHSSWWRPRLVLRARRLDAFDGMPGAKPGAIVLRIRRRFREQAEAFVAAVEQARAATPMPPLETLPEIDASDVPPLIDGGDT